jgi:hypothetical protein
MKLEMLNQPLSSVVTNSDHVNESRHKKCPCNLLASFQPTRTVVFPARTQMTAEYMMDNIFSDSYRKGGTCIDSVIDIIT